MDFSDILSYPSPSDNAIQQILSSDLHACERYLTACSKLVNILSDHEIDVRSVHYKYRLERFLRSRSKTSRRFVSIYERRFPELAIPKNQVFKYDKDGNVSIDCSQPTTTSKNHPPIIQSPISSSIVEENLSVPNKYLTGWTIAVYTPRQSLLPFLEQQYLYSIPIRLPWIVKRKKSEGIICDLRPLFQKGPCYVECDLRYLFDEGLAPVKTVVPHHPATERLVGQQLCAPKELQILSDVRFETIWNLLLILVFVNSVVIVVNGMKLSLLCYASLGVLVIHYVVGDYIG